MDSPYLFLHPGFSIVANLAHPEEMLKKTKRSWIYMSENGVDLPYLFLRPGFSIIASLAHPEEMLERDVYIPVDFYWVSEASPTLGCSIETSRDICVSVVVQKA